MLFHCLQQCCGWAADTRCLCCFRVLCKTAWKSQMLGATGEKKEEKQTGLVKQHIPEEMDPLIWGWEILWDLKNLDILGGIQIWLLELCHPSLAHTPIKEPPYTAWAGIPAPLWWPHQGCFTILEGKLSPTEQPEPAASNHDVPHSLCDIMWHFEELGPVIFSVILKVLVAIEWRSLPCWSKWTCLMQCFPITWLSLHRSPSLDCRGWPSIDNPHFHCIPHTAGGSEQLFQKLHFQCKAEMHQNFTVAPGHVYPNTTVCFNYGMGFYLNRPPSVLLVKGLQACTVMWVYSAPRAEICTSPCWRAQGFCWPKPQLTRGSLPGSFFIDCDHLFSVFRFAGVHSGSHSNTWGLVFLGYVGRTLLRSGRGCSLWPLGFVTSHRRICCPRNHLTWLARAYGCLQVSIERASGKLIRNWSGKIILKFPLSLWDCPDFSWFSFISLYNFPYGIKKFHMQSKTRLQSWPGSHLTFQTDVRVFLWGLQCSKTDKRERSGDRSFLQVLGLPLSQVGLLRIRMQGRQPTLCY